MKKQNRIWIFPFIIMGLVLISTNSCKKEKEKPTDTDIDGNVCHSVIIGTQTWMVENLKVTKYRNGDPITNVTDSATWSNLSTGAYVNYNNDANNAGTYGRLYNWYAVKDSRNIAPQGWHLPSDTEWETLATFIGGIAVAGGKMKETGTTHWLSPNTGATNDVGFSALPAGGRIESGFFALKFATAWWSSTEYNAEEEWFREIDNNTVDLLHGTGSKNNGFSVRCVKD